MNRDMMVHVTPFEVHVSILEDDCLVEYYVERKKDRSIVGNIYKGRVGKVLPGMQSAFVDIGIEKNAFLYVTDFFEEYEELKETLDEDLEGRKESRIVVELPTLGPAGEPLAEEPLLAAEDAEMEAPGSEPDGPAPPSVPEPAPAAPAEPGRERERRHRRRRRSSGSQQKASQAPAAVLPEPVPAASAPERLSAVEPGPAGKAVPAVSATREAAPENTAGVERGPVPPELAVSAVAPVAPAKPARGRRSAKVALERFDLEQEAEHGPSKPDEVRSAGVYLKETDVPFSGGGQSRGGRRHKRKGYGFASESEPGNISTMLRPGQEIIVQVSKEPIALKSARITSHISMPGRQLVFLPTVNHVGVSRKIRSDQERKRLRSVIAKNRQDRTGGFIIRTASEGVSEEDLSQDMDYLMKTWHDILSRGSTEKSPCLLYEEFGLVARILRDKLDDSFQSIWVDDEKEYASIVSFVDHFMPQLLPRVKLYLKEKPIFDFFNLTQEVQRATAPKVWLRSGGFIVINHTEALVAIDVNTGKYVGKGGNFEETIAKTNMDAAKEIARQVRLRNLGGIIVMDFIDMVDKKNKRQVLDLLLQEMRRDKAPSKILPFNDFGMVVMTRKRTASSLEKNLLEPCPGCGGSGLTRSTASICYEIFEQVEHMQGSLGGKRLICRANAEVVRALKNEERAVLDEIRSRFKLDLTLIPDPLLPLATFDVVSE